jgi:hypothetical protein
MFRLRLNLRYRYCPQNASLFKKPLSVEPEVRPAGEELGRGLKRMKKGLLPSSNQLIITGLTFIVQTLKDFSLLSPCREMFDGQNISRQALFRGS